MKKTCIYSVFAGILLFIAANLYAEGVKISGDIIDGYRVIAVSDEQKELNLTVYRGDYIKFDVEDSFSWMQKLSVPGLSIDEVLTADFDVTPYFKMKTEGTYAISLGDKKGTLTVISYRNPRYSEVTAQEASTLIANIKPLVLDVRTAGEYRSGHLKDALLIPLNELQKRVGEIASHKHEDILIYCATGNRSTVASKILIDEGFRRIYNLRKGIADWAKEGNPIVK